MPRTVVRHESEHLYAEEPNTPAGQRLSRAILHFRNAERIQADTRSDSPASPAWIWPPSGIWCRAIATSAISAPRT